MTTFEADTSALDALVGAPGYADSLSRRVPPGARFATAAEVPGAAVAKLYAQYIWGQPHAGHRIAWLQQDPARWRHSPALLVDRELRGMVLLERERDYGVVHAKVVTPGFRGGWPNALLTVRMAEAFRALEVTRFRFESRENNLDTLKFARRLHADSVDTKATFELALAP